MEALLALLLMLGPVQAPNGAWCGTFTVTAYSSESWPGGTADGTPTKGNEWTVVSVDPKVVPLQWRVTIPSIIEEWGIGELRAADTGGGVRGSWLDVLTNTDRQANLIGRSPRYACVRAP